MTPKTLKTINRTRKKEKKIQKRGKSVGRDACSLILSFQYCMRLKVIYTIPNDSKINVNFPLPFERKKIEESSRS